MPLRIAHLNKSEVHERFNPFLEHVEYFLNTLPVSNEARALFSKVVDDNEQWLFEVDTIGMVNRQKLPGFDPAFDHEVQHKALENYTKYREELLEALKPLLVCETDDPTRFAINDASNLKLLIEQPQFLYIKDNAHPYILPCMTKDHYEALVKAMPEALHQDKIITKIIKEKVIVPPAAPLNEEPTPEPQAEVKPETVIHQHIHKTYVLEEKKKNHTWCCLLLLLLLLLLIAGGAYAYFKYFANGKNGEGLPFFSSQNHTSTNDAQHGAVGDGVHSATDGSQDNNGANEAHRASDTNGTSDATGMSSNANHSANADGSDKDHNAQNGDTVHNSEKTSSSKTESNSTNSLSSIMGESAGDGDNKVGDNKAAGAQDDKSHEISTSTENSSSSKSDSTFNLDDVANKADGAANGQESEQNNAQEYAVKEDLNAKHQADIAAKLNELVNKASDKAAKLNADLNNELKGDDTNNEGADKANQGKSLDPKDKSTTPNGKSTPDNVTVNLIGPASSNGKAPESEGEVRTIGAVPTSEPKGEAPQGADKPDGKKIVLNVTESPVVKGNKNLSGESGKGHNSGDGNLNVAVAPGGGDGVLAGGAGPISGGVAAGGGDAGKEPPKKAEPKKSEPKKKLVKCSTTETGGAKLIMATDGSGSMIQLLPDRVTRMDAAIKAAHTVIDTVDKKVPISYIGIQGCPVARYYGTFGANQRTILKGHVDQTDPRLFRFPEYVLTPLVSGMRKMGELAAKEKVALGILISDGVDTCEGTRDLDICQVAREVHKKAPNLMINVILIGNDAPNAQCVADITGGKVYRPENATEIMRDLKLAAGSFNKVCKQHVDRAKAQDVPKHRTLTLIVYSNNANDLRA